MVYSVYFSPTGGTKKVLDVLAGVFGEVKEVDLSRTDTGCGRYILGPEDVCIIGVPSFGGRVPGVALERLRQLQAKGAKAVLTAVYGNRAIDDTLAELADAARECGFRVAAGIEAVAEHSIMHQFGAGRPDMEDRKKLTEFAQQIKKRLEIEEGWEEPELPGNRPYREYGGVPFKPSAQKACTRCGLCAARCPVGAILKENPASVDSAVCISCMRCVEECPQKARKLNPVMLFAASKKMEKACKSRKENQLYL